jgi:hypothetical protein
MPRTARFGATALAALLVGCAGTPGPGDPGYPYNASGEYTGAFVVEGQTVNATMQLETAPGGAVTGSFRVSSMGIRGEITGTVTGDQLTFEAAYRNPESGCDGVAAVTATIGEGGESLEGSLSVYECGQTMGGSMRFRR